MPSQDSTIGFGHDIEQKNPTSQMNEAVEASWRPPVSETTDYVTFDDPWGVNPKFDGLHSYFPGKLSLLRRSSSPNMHRQGPKPHPSQSQISMGM